MARLPRVTPAEMVWAPQRAGFVADRQKGSHLTLLHPDSMRRVVVPMHRQTLGVGLAAEILRQAAITADRFRELLR